MPKSLSKSEIAVHLAATTGVTKKQAAAVLEHITQLAYKNAKNTFVLPGLGKLVLVHRKARVGRNPATGQPISIPAKKGSKVPRRKSGKRRDSGKLRSYPGSRRGQYGHPMRADRVPLSRIAVQNQDERI